jgi:tryptophan-rich sensory protein
MTPRITSLAIFLLLVVLAAAAAGSFEAGDWYRALYKPSWAPPWQVFGPVWAILYVLMALAAWKIWLTGTSLRIGALTWWFIQLALNIAWSWLIFGLERPGWALMELSVLIAMVVMCIRAFSLLSRPAGALMVPYLLWLLFAWFLFFSIWLMNGGGLGSIL